MAELSYKPNSNIHHFRAPKNEVMDDITYEWVDKKNIIMKEEMPNTSLHPDLIQNVETVRPIEPEYILSDNIVQIQSQCEFKTEFEHTRMETNQKESTVASVGAACSLTHGAPDQECTDKQNGADAQTMELLFCNTCKKQFKYKKPFVMHLAKHVEAELKKRTHTKEKEHFFCNICSKEFKYKSTFLIHERAHSGEKPYSCDICQKEFSQKSAVTRHMLSHSGEKSYSCDLCSSKFSIKSNLMSHMKTHAEKKSFSCHLCEQTFKWKANLLTHIKIHSNLKPFPCDLCGKKFSQKGNLDTHRKIHTGDNMYSCDRCPRKFTQKHNLTHHMTIHYRLETVYVPM